MLLQVNWNKLKWKTNKEQIQELICLTLRHKRWAWNPAYAWFWKSSSWCWSPVWKAVAEGRPGQTEPAEEGRVSHLLSSHSAHTGTSNAPESSRPIKIQAIYLTHLTLCKYIPQHLANFTHKLTQKMWFHLGLLMIRHQALLSFDHFLYEISKTVTSLWTQYINKIHDLRIVAWADYTKRLIKVLIKC